MFPKANYLIVTSRLHPGRDGGYTVAVMRRARQFREVGGVKAVLLTVDFSPEYPEFLHQFRRIGLADSETVLRNLYQDARADPRWLWRAVPESGQVHGDVSGLVSSTECDSAGTPWRTVWSDPAAGGDADAIAFTDYLDRSGRPLLRTPYLRRPDWHLSTEPITVFRDGEAVGAFGGFGELYRAWLSGVIAAADPALPTFLVSESRQVGELITGLRGDRVKLVHTVHNAHSDPGKWDPDRERLWRSWLERLPHFDAVVWLTEGQHRDVVRRFGEPSQFAVIPHPVDQPAITPAGAGRSRDPQAALMLTRLAPQKQVNHAIRAFAAVRRSNPNAHLEIYGDGPLRQSLAALIVELGLTGAVRLRGYHPHAADELKRASVLMVSSRYEGQSLVCAEAFARGCPVVAYNVNYGPGEMIENGVNGYLVSAGNVRALAGAVGRLLGHPGRVEAFSQAAFQTAAKMSVARAMSSWSGLFHRLLAGSG